MFVLKKEASYFWPVSVELPVDGGKFKKETFDAQFKRIEQSKLKEMLSSDTMNDVDFCKMVVVGWKGIVDDAGAAIPFSETSLSEVLEIPKVATTIAKAYLESLDGAARKN